jgi:nucleoside-diphosphate-sugar epimerase
LITGLRGFTGRYAADELKSAGYEVLDLVRRVDGIEIPIDLLDRESLRQAIAEMAPDVVLHLAAIAFVDHGDAEAIYRTNIVGTRNLLEALAASPQSPQAVLLASSANVYGNSDIEILTEATSPAPANDYAVSKLAMEHMAALWRDRLPLTIARPFNYTGVGQSDKFLIPKIVGHFRSRLSVIELGNIDVARDFQDVRFVVDAYRRLLEGGAAGQTVNICSGMSYSLTQVIEMMQHIAGYQIEVRVNPAFVRQGEVARLTGSNRKLAELIGPLDVVPLRQTLQWMYETTDSVQ